MDVHTRKLRYFVTVAEELHFSRAAARLFIAQQALSKQIRELEDTVGTPLLSRTTRRVELTAAGEVFLAAAREVLAALDSGADAARRGGQGLTGTLKVGFVVAAALELTGPILGEFRSRYPDVRLELREFPFEDPSEGLAAGSTDVAFVRVPVSMPDLELEPLFVEPVVAGLSSGHPLASRDSISVRELLHEPIAVGRTADAAWQAFWTLEEYRHGSSASRIFYTSSQTEEIELVAAGSACNVTPAAAARYTPHPGVRFVPIDDVSGSTVAVGWRRGRRTPLVDQFIEVARDVRDRETDTVDGIEHPFQRPTAETTHEA